MTEDRKKALIVEDSPAQALALRHLLIQEGLEVLWALDGRIGIALAYAHQPDVIILDIEMPNMNGFEACKALNQDPRTVGIPIIMLTVRAEPDSVMQGIDLGAIDFIPKDTYSNKVLLETLRQLHILDGARVAAAGGGDSGILIHPDQGNDG
jgi:CheY-like chemotaxis protein